MRGRAAASCSKRSSNVTSPNMSWKNTADSPTAATARAIAVSIVAPCAPQRVDIEASATATMAALLSCSNSRTMSGLKFVSDDCAQSIDDGRSPGSQSRMPTKWNPGPLNTLA
jgi:hypothetical protein